MTYKEKLNSILAKEVDELSEEEITYLKIKNGYLSDSEREKFTELLGSVIRIPGVNTDFNLNVTKSKKTKRKKTKVGGKK